MLQLWLNKIASINNVLPKKERLTLSLAYKTKEEARNILSNIDTPRSTKIWSSVEQFIWYVFEKLFERQIWGKLIDISWKNPDVIATINWIQTFFEVKASRYWNCVVLKENQLNHFSLIPNCFYVLFYYSCNNPEKTFKKLWPKKFKNALEIRYMYILPAKIILAFYNQSSLIRRDKVARTWEPTIETFIKLHRNTLEKYLINKIWDWELNRIWKTTYYWINLNNYKDNLIF